MMEYVVIGIKPYSFPNKETGEYIQGIKVTYLDEHMQDAISTPMGRKVPNNMMPQNTVGIVAKGYAPMTLSVPLDLYPKFQQVPGIYDLRFHMRPDSKGKPTLSLVDADFVAPVSLAPQIDKSKK